MRRFIVGTDWWTDCDDAVAMRILARAVKAGKIAIEGIGINGCMEHSVASLKGFLTREGVGGIPLGIDRQAFDFGGNPPYQKRLSAYANEGTTNDHAQDAVRLYRKILAMTQEKIEIIEIGYLQVVAAVLESGGDDICPKTGLELVKEKVSKMWVMAGKWDENPGRENNFARNARSRVAAEIFCRRCPVPVTFLGYEIGVDVITGDCLREDDILYQALCDHGSYNGRMSWDPMLVLMAIKGDEALAGYDVVRGTARVDATTGENYFAQSGAGTHQYVVRKYDISHYKNEINMLIE